MLYKEKARAKRHEKSFSQMKISLLLCIPDEEQSMCHYQTVRVASANPHSCIEIELS